MNSIITYGIIFVILLLLELAYFKIADKFNIIDKPFGKGLMVKWLILTSLQALNLLI